MQDATLELIGALAPGSTDDLQLATNWSAPALHGWADGKRVTLLGAYARGTKNTIATTHSVQQTVETQHGVLVDGDRHISNLQENAFRKLIADIDYLTLWSGMQTINYEAFVNESGTSRLSASSTSAKELEANYGDWTFIVSLTSAPTIGSTIRRNRVELSEWCTLQIISKKKTSAESFLKPLRVFQNLLTHATQKPCLTRSIILYEGVEPGPGRGYRWHRPEMPSHSDEKVDARTELNTLFTAGDINFPDLVTSWFNLHTKLDGAMDVLMSLSYEPKAIYETKVLNSATVLESFHREFFSKSLKRDPGLHKKVQDLIRKNLPSEHHADVLNGYTNAPGYMRRCTEIASLPDPTATAELLGDIEQWTKWVTKARNHLAHLNPPNKRKIPDDIWLFLAPVTAALLHLTLMAELGVSSELQQKAVKMGGLSFTASAYRKFAEEHL